LGVAQAASTLAHDSRWRIDDLPAVEWWQRRVSWTRDPFDRLLAAHALQTNYPVVSSEGD
jgi:PIN domain nuclease of toxin-antitoxin system